MFILIPPKLIGIDLFDFSIKSSEVSSSVPFLLYLSLIPFSIYHFQSLNKKFKNENIENEEHEDIL